MTHYLDADRRRKVEGHHLEHVVKVRFTSSELDTLDKAAAMATEGRLAPLIHDLALEALSIRKRRKADLMTALAEGRPLNDNERVELADLLARTAEDQLLGSIDTHQTA